MKKHLIISLIISIILGSGFGFAYFYLIKNKTNPLYIIIAATLIAVFLLLLSYLILEKKLTRSKETYKRKFRDALKTKDSILASSYLLQSKAPIGIVAYSEDLFITFANDFSLKVFESKLLGKTVESISEELKDFIVSDKLETKITVYSKTLSVSIDRDNQFVFFTDVTEIAQAVEMKEKTKLAFVVYKLENLESECENLEIQKRIKLMSQYFLAVSKWAKEFSLYSYQNEENNDFFIAKESSIKDLVDDGFSVIKKVNDISEINGMHIYLSIGIGYGSDDFDTLGSYAEDALSYSIKKGQADATIFNGQEYKSFSKGKREIVDQQFSQSAKVYANQLIKAVKNSSFVLIAPHVDTDADALGSALAVKLLCDNLKVPSKIILSKNKIDSTCKKIFEASHKEAVDFEDSFISVEDVKNYKEGKPLLVLVDHHLESLSVASKIISEFSDVVIIDHHRIIDPISFSHSLEIVDPNSSSTCEIVLAMASITSHTYEIPTFIANIMLLGISIDTANFTIKTSSLTLEMAALLMEEGASLDFVRLMSRESRENELKKAIILNEAESFDGVSIIKLNGYQEKEDLAKAADYLLSIDGTDASFVLGKLNRNEVGISARSAKDINVSEIMALFGGGGRFNMAASQIKNKKLNEVYDELLNTLKNYKSGGSLSMKIILKSDVKKVGKKGDIVEVASGYGNFLVLKGFAIEATESNINTALDERAKEESEKALHIEQANQLKAIIENLVIVVEAKVKENGEFYGSVTAKEISEKLADNNIMIDKKKIVIKDSKINHLGSIKIDIKLYPGITAKLRVDIKEANK